MLRVLRELIAAADERGFVPNSWLASVASAAAGIPASEMSVCVDLLSRHGAISAESASPSVVEVRLHATATRIRAETGNGERGGALRLLRTLHRIAGPALSTGVMMDLAILPREFGGVHHARTMLEELQNRQLLTMSSTGAGLVVPGGVSAEMVLGTLDWARLERRRGSELAKLEAMQSYALTRSCRRAFVLRYFGDRGTASRCSSCDNCCGEGSGVFPTAGKQKSRSRNIQRRFRL